MHYTKYTRIEYLYKLRDITSMSTEVEEVRNVVSGYGYDSVKLQEGKRMVDEFERLSKEASRNSIAKKKLFAQKKKEQEAIRKKYMKFLKLARIAFIEDVGAQEVLALAGARERTFEKWLFQVTAFVDNLISSEDYLQAIGVYGVTKEDVQGLRNDLNKLSELEVKCAKITGVVRLLNHKIKKETIVIQHWISSYIKVARIAMEENPKVSKLFKQAIGS